MYMYGKMSRLQIWGLAVALVLVLRGARQTLANIAENKGDEGGGLRGSSSCRQNHLDDFSQI